MTPASVLDLAPGVELVRNERTASPVWYVVVDDHVRYVLDEPDTRAWCEVMRALDGHTSLGAISARLGHDFAAIAPRAEEALEFQLVLAAG